MLSSSGRHTHASFDLASELKIAVMPQLHRRDGLDAPNTIPSETLGTYSRQPGCPAADAAMTTLLFGSIKVGMSTPPQAGNYTPSSNVAVP